MLTNYNTHAMISLYRSAKCGWMHLFLNHTSVCCWCYYFALTMAHDMIVYGVPIMSSLVAITYCSSYASNRTILFLSHNTIDTMYGEIERNKKKNIFTSFLLFFNKVCTFSGTIHQQHSPNNRSFICNPIIKMMSNLDMGI